MAADNRAPGRSGGTHRTSKRWTLTGELTADTRAVLADHLGCAFSDENQPRTGMTMAPDVTVVAVVDARHVRLVAHFTSDDVFTTRVDWIDTWVHKAAAAAALTVTSGPVDVTHGRP